MLIKIFSCASESNLASRFYRNLFLKSRLANRGPEVFLIRVLLNLWVCIGRCEWLDLSNAIEDAELSLTMFSLLLIAHAFCTGMHRCASVIDRPWSLPTAGLRNMFALGCSAQSLLSASEKSVTPNAIVKHFSQTLLQMRYFCRLKTLTVSSYPNV